MNPYTPLQIQDLSLSQALGAIHDCLGQSVPELSNLSQLSKEPYLIDLG